MYQAIKAKALSDPKYHKSILDFGIEMIAQDNFDVGKIYVEIYIEILTDKWEAKSVIHDNKTWS
jgi:hypothetical protein